MVERYIPFNAGAKTRGACDLDQPVAWNVAFIAACVTAVGDRRQRNAHHKIVVVGEGDHANALSCARLLIPKPITGLAMRKAGIWFMVFVLIGLAYTAWWVPANSNQFQSLTNDGIFINEAPPGIRYLPFLGENHTR